MRPLCLESLEVRRMLAVDFGQVGAALDTQLLGMQTQLTTTLNNYQTGPNSSIPLVGNTLGSSAQIVNRFNTELQSALTSLGTITNPTNSQIQNALVGVPFLADRNDNGVDPEDVIITRSLEALGSEGFAVQMRLQAAQAVSPATVSFSTGLPSLPLSVAASGTVEISVGFAFELAFTYNSNNQQVALDSTKMLTGLEPPDANHPIVDPHLHPLAIFVSAGLSGGFSASAKLGFVQGTATPIADQANALHLTVMVNHLSGTPTIKLDGVADANLRLTGGFAGTNEDFPGIDADFHLHWSFSSNTSTANPPQVTIDNVALDLGQFLSNVLKPVFGVIQTTTAPMQPLEELFHYELPVLTDLSRLLGGKPVTLLTLASLVAPYTPYGPLFDLIRSMSDLTHSINQIDLSDTLKMPLGGFNLNNYDLRGVATAGDVHDLNLQNLTDFAIANVQESVLPSEATEFLQKLADTMSNGYEIAFPILDDPKAAVFGLLLGRDADLFSFTANYSFDSQSSALPSFSVYGMGVVFEGDVHMEAKFKFAYDTYGLRQLVNHLADGDSSQVAEDVLAGFYIAADSFFSLSGGLKAGVGARFAILSVTLGGFVTTDNEGNEPVRISFNDPNNDGKVRLAEFDEVGLDTSGRFVAALGLEVKVGVTVLGKFIGLKKRFDIASTIIVDLNTPDPNAPVIPTGPILASQPDDNGSILLYVGESAHLREEVRQTNGDDRIVIRNIETTAQGETIEIALRQEVRIGELTLFEYWVPQTITGVNSIAGYGDLGDLVIDVLPGVNVDVHFVGGQGRSEFMYSGAGSAYLQAGEEDAYLVGGLGGNVLLGGPGNDTLVLGSGGNLATGGLGDNTFVILTPLIDSGAILGGDDGNNTFVVLAGEGTQWISAMPAADGSINLNYQIADAPPSPGLGLRQFSTLVVSAQDRATDITIGDLSPAGVSQVIVSNPSVGAGGRNIVLDTKAGGGTSQITVASFLHTFVDEEDPENPVLVQRNELQVVNATTGVTTYLLGMKDTDLTTIRQHGGSAHIGQLSKNEGALAFDFSSRQPGAVQTVTMTTPALDSGNWITSHASAGGDFVLNAINYPTLIFDGLRVVDSITTNVAAPTQAAGLNQLLLDASSLVGTLNVVPLGDSSAHHLVTVSKLSEQGNIAVHGGNASTAATFGTGRLADIRGGVSIQNAVLTIDNSSAQSFSFLTMTETTFSGWTIPGFIGNPELAYSGLYGVMTVRAGADDRFTLDGTPSSIASAVFHNATSSRDQVYIADWTKPLTFNGDFSLYLGGRLLIGDLHRIKRLTGLANLPITMNFSSVIGGGTRVVFDGDLDPDGASYTIDGDGNLVAINQTLGLSVTINGYRDQDEVHVHLPGGSVVANLVQTGPGTIYVDGTARSTGINPTAANNITAILREGAHTLDPTGTTGTVLHAFNTMYPLGNLTQDDLTLNQPTVTAANTLTADASQLVGTLHLNALDPLAGVLGPYGLTMFILAAVNPQLAVFVEGNNPFPGSGAYQADQTTFAFGAGQLARIQGNVTASKVVLAINDSAAAQPSDLMLTDTTFNNWSIPGSSLRPALAYSNLYRTLTVYAGAADRFDLNRTPAGVTDLVMHNVTATLDPVYTAAWTVPIALNGHFSFFAGQRLVVDDLNQEQQAIVERERRLGGVPVPVRLNFSGVAASEVVLDGDVDPAGAQYTIDGRGNLYIENHTVGLSVTINGYRDQDELYVFMPGATVAANLHYTSPGTIYLDGRARLAGTNPTAANDITIEARYGQTELVPLGEHDSRLEMYNDVYLLGAMPQDSLAVNVPTNVRITPSKPNLIVLDNTPNSWIEVYAARWDAFIAWKEGPGTGHTSLFNNARSYASNWDSNYSNLPNPFVEFAYGIDVPYEDAPLSEGYYNLFQPDGGTLLSGTGRYFIVDPHPVAVNNDVRLDASQLRGSFQFNVTGPDYDYIRLLVRESFKQFPTESYFSQPFFHSWYSEYDHMRIAFGQSNIVLSHVNPELSAQINSANQDFAYPAGTFPPNSGPAKQVVVSDYPVTALDVGNGVLANIQGDVSVLGVKLTVDDSAGTAADNLILTGSTLSDWSPAAGTTQPVLTMSALENWPLTLIGSELDRFGIEGTPATAGSTIIRNVDTGEAPSEVYLMGKNPDRPLEIMGNFHLSIGHRLHADGTVEQVGQVAGVLAASSFPPVNRTITYDFTGPGYGQLVYDASNHVAGDITVTQQGQAVITPDPTNPTRGRLLFDQSHNVVIYNGDTDLDLYGPTIPAQNPSFASLPRLSVLVDHRFPSTVRYFAGPTIPPHTVRVMSAYGPVFIEGRGPLTRVEIDPANVFIGTISVSAFVSPGDDLRDTILADVTVTNSFLTIRPDVATTPAPEQLKHAVLTDTQVTGIAGATIHYADLRDFQGLIGLSAFPGLVVQMPRHGANLTILDTPASAVTGIHVIGLPLADVRVLKTTGRLALGTNGVADSVGTFVQFAAQSLTIGDGSVQNIRGEVWLGSLFTTTAGTVIDNRDDPLPRNVAFHATAINGISLIEGLAPATIRIRQLPGGLRLYGSAGSHFTLHTLSSVLAEAVSLYAGAGSSVDLVAPSNANEMPRVRVLGAETVRVLVPPLEPVQQRVLVLFGGSLAPIRVEADPARPNDLTHLIADYSEVGIVNVSGAVVANFVHLLDNTGIGMGRVSLLGNLAPVTHFLFQADTTLLTLIGSKWGNSPREIRIVDSGSRGTVIHPGRQSVNVLGTTGPVEIRQPLTPPAFSVPFGVVLGNAGNMQAILGEMTIIGDNSVLPTIPLQLNDSADGASRTVSVSYPATDHWALTGLAPATIHVLGNFVATSLLAGAGNNTLVGPDAQNLWEINATNGGNLNGKLPYSNFANLVGGALGDEFFFKQGGLVGGNLDGGPDYDVIRFDSYVLPEAATIDLPGGIVPFVNGVVTNVEAVIAPLIVLPVANQSSAAGATIVPFKIFISGGVAVSTYSAVGLPSGLAIDAQTGFISGTISADAVSGSPYQVTVSATDGFETAIAHFQWIVTLPTINATGVSISAIEGMPFQGLVATFTAVDASLTASDFTAVIEWGDNETSAGTIVANGSGGFGVTGGTSGHIYVTAGTYPVQVTIHSSTNDVAAASSTAHVSSVRAVGTTVTASKGQTFSGSVASFVSADASLTAADFTATIDWGDGGAVSVGSVFPNEFGGFDVTGSHTYAAAGAYPINVTVTESGSAGATATHGGWQPAEAMSAARYLFAAATGGDGRIYAFGGYSPLGILNSAESYNPSTGVWDAIPNMPQTRTYFAAAAGGDGRLYVLGGTSGSTFLSTVDVFDPIGGTWNASPVASMLTGRSQPAAVTGADGRVYVFGGYGGSGFVTQPEVYDPATNSWTALAAMPSERVNFAVAAGQDGLIYMLGGYDANHNANPRVDVYDPATDTWTMVASLPSPRANLSAAAGPAGQIYAVGGYHPNVGYAGTVEAFDPATNTWITLPSLSLGRAYLAAVAGADGQIYALGGFASNFQISSSVEALSGVALVTDPDFQATGRVIDATEQAAFTAIVASFIGTDSIESFTATIHWGDGQTSAGAITGNVGDGFDISGDHTYATPGHFSIAVVVRNGAVTTAANSTAVAHHLPRAAGVEVRATAGTEFTGDVATFTADPDDPASGFTAIINWGDNSSSVGVVSANGGGSFSVLGSHTYAVQGTYPIRVEITDPRGQSTTSRGAWTSVASLAEPRYWSSAVTGIDGRLFVLGGYGPSSRVTSIDAYDPVTNSWTTATHLPTTRTQFAAATGLDGRIYVLGGYDTGITNLAEAYDPATNTWITLASMPTARLDFAAVTGTDGRIYVMGGYAADYTILASVDVYDPSLNTWTSVASMTAARAEFAAALGGDGRIYALGGYGANYNILRSVEAYDTASDDWMPVADMDHARVAFAAATGSDGRVYALGGYSQHTGYTASVEAYDTSTDGWSSISAMSIPRAYFAMARAGDGRLYAVGGDYTNSVEAYSIGAIVAAGQSLDLDADGVLDSIEDGAPHQGDGNQDGIPDRLQNNVASLPNLVNGNYVTLVTPLDNPLVDVAALANPSPNDAPSGVSFPVGLFQFSVTNLTPGAATTVTLFLSNPVSINSYYAFGKTVVNPTDHWYEFLFDGTTGAEFIRDAAGQTTQIVLHFLDGGRGDHDLTANGVVVDPSAPAYVVDFTPTVSVSVTDGTYNGTPFVATSTVAGADGIATASLEGVFPTFSYYVGTSVDLNGLLTSAPTDAGTYTVVAHFAGSANYTLANSDALLFVIDPAALTVTVDADPGTPEQDAFSKVYGDVNPAFTVRYDGLVNGDTPSSLGGALAFSTTATASSPVGSYDVVADCHTSSNYTITYVPGTLNITPAALTVTVDANSSTPVQDVFSKVYGADNPAFTVRYDGLAGGDTASSLGGALAFSTTATASSPVGSYAVSAGGQTSSNYTISFIPGTLNISKAVLTVTPDNKVKVYGQTFLDFTGRIEGLRNGDAITASYTSPGATATASIAGSPYGIMATIDSSSLLDNYTVTYNVGRLTVQNVAILPDPLRPGQFALFVGGSAKDDKIHIKTKGNQIEVSIDSDKVKRVEMVSGSFSRLVVYGAEGNDQIHVHDKVTIPAWIFGGDGNDDLRAGGGPSLLMGGNGNDKLSSGKGRGILIGGPGADHLLGGKVDDILIGGATDYDANDAALAAIMEEWNSAGTYADRVQRLSGTKPGGSTWYLNASTVHDDGQPDHLVGGAGLDWYFAKLDKSKATDKISGHKKDEIVTALS